MADYEGGRVRAKPDDGLCDLLGLAYPPQPALPQSPLSVLRGVPPVKRVILGVSM